MKISVFTKKLFTKKIINHFKIEIINHFKKEIMKKMSLCYFLIPISLQPNDLDILNYE